MYFDKILAKRLSEYEELIFDKTRRLVCRFLKPTARLNQNDITEISGVLILFQFIQRFSGIIFAADAALNSRNQ